MAQRLNVLSPRPSVWAGLLACVLFFHWLVIGSVADQMADTAIDAAMAPRLTAVYLRELEPAEPPPPPAITAPAPVVEPASPRSPTTPVAAAAAEPAASAASAPDVVEPAVDVAEAAPPPAEPASAPVPEQMLVAQELPAIGADPVQPGDPVAGVNDAEANDTQQPFVWPASTRLDYVLTGNYRGEVHGSAQVEWINADPNYQVNLDVTIGLPFAPLLRRQMRSDGLIGPTGLRPSRYDQRSKMAFQEPRATSLRIHDQRVSTADGRPLPMPFLRRPMPSPDGLETSIQDSASQFVHMTWLFTTRPHLLTPGTTISFPLALPGRVAAWGYQVGPAQTLSTRFGPLEAYRVFTAPGVIRGRDLLAEVWFSPQLAYLPVRIRIEQDADVYIDLVIKEKPQIAGR